MRRPLNSDRVAIILGAKNIHEIAETCTFLRFFLRMCKIYVNFAG